MTRMLIMGPPGAGKGTHAASLSKTLAIPHISTGELFRDHVKNETPIGQELAASLARGQYAPDSVTNTMVREVLKGKQGFILDGYPRTEAQVGELDSILGWYELELVLVLEADEDELVERLLKRAVDEKRPDDTPDVIRRRQKIYGEETASLIGIYDSRGLVVRVDAMGSVEEVGARIMAAVEKLV